MQKNNSNLTYTIRGSDKAVDIQQQSVGFVKNSSVKALPERVIVAKEAHRMLRICAEQQRTNQKA